MTEEALQEVLSKTTAFPKRQRLLKQLWILRRQREAQQDGGHAWHCCEQKAAVEHEMSQEAGVEA
jgi:hypothetical protein